MRKWIIEIQRRRADDNEEVLDWCAAAPGPEMRFQLGRFFKPGISGSGTRAYLCVKYIPTNEGKEAKIIKDRRRYRAEYHGESLTLEAATDKMKEELRPNDSKET